MNLPWCRPEINGACSKNLSERQTENILIFYLSAQIFLFLLHSCFRPHYGGVQDILYQGDFKIGAKTRMLSFRGVRITVYKCCRCPASRSGPEVYYHGLNNYKETKLLMSSLLVLIRVYGLETQSVMLAFSTGFVN
jgi:hypothetical protein